MQLQTIAARHGLDLSWRRLVTIPGTTTAPDNLIIRTAIEAWENVEGRAPQTTPGMSGATAANILRAHGVPTARIGLPKVRPPDIDFQRGMNIASLDASARQPRPPPYSLADPCCAARQP